MPSFITLLQILFGLATGLLFLFVTRVVAPGRASMVLSLGLTGAAAIYVGFAIWGHAPPLWLAAEIGGLILYSALAWGSAYGVPRLVALGWLAHPLWDVGLHWSGTGADYAPHWYVVACPSFDILVGVYLIAKSRSQRSAHAPRHI